MTTAQELRDLIYNAGLERAAQSGTIGEVSRTDHSVIIASNPLGLLRGFGGTPTTMQVVPSESDVRIIILGGRPGVPVNADLATVAIAGQPLPQVAQEVVTVVANYLATSTS